MTTAILTESCVACGGRLAFFGTRQAYTYARCRQCETVQLSPMPTSEMLERAYSEDYARSGHHGTDPESIFEASAPFYQAVLKELQLSGRPAGPILDVGCGWGGMCRHLRANGYDYLGIDFESESLEYCRSLGLNVRAGGLSAFAGNRHHYSAILLLGVFEHLNNHGELLDQVAAMLKPGGVLVILSPTSKVYSAAARMLQAFTSGRELPELHSAFCPPWHTTIFSTRGARRLIERHGFVVDRVIASPSGRNKGPVRLVQSLLTFAARTGSGLFGERWPLVLSHIFVCRAREASA